MTRATFTSRDVRAGCFVCHGDEAKWFGPQAQGTAARHHDASGHTTWCDVAMLVRYGTDAADSRQIDIEDAIAAPNTAAEARPGRPAPAISHAGQETANV